MRCVTELSTEKTDRSAASVCLNQPDSLTKSQSQTPGLRLNLGCGPLSLEGEIGVDRFPGPAVDVVADILELPYPDDCAEFVRLDHVLEHLEGRKVVPALLEAKRLLMPGGRIRVGVPDFEASCQAYLETTRMGDKALVMRWFYGSQAHDGEYHKSGWDRETLQDLLQIVGFTQVVVSDDSDRTEGLCIFAEGVKA